MNSPGQCSFRVYFFPAADIYQREQQVAEFFGTQLFVLLLQRVFYLWPQLVRILKLRNCVVEFKSAFSGPIQYAVGPQEGWQTGRSWIEDRKMGR